MANLNCTFGSLSGGLILCVLYKTFLIGAVLTLGNASARASDLFTEILSRTHLVGIKPGGQMSDLADKLRIGGFELSDGAFVSFERWYKPRWEQISFDFMTRLKPNIGLLWGFSTGEDGPKYHISPQFKIGIMGIQPIGERAMVSLSLERGFGGRLRERACIADYGEITGLQAVNCRMAGSVLPPEETLDYLLNVKPRGLSRIGFSYRVSL